MFDPGWQKRPIPRLHYFRNGVAARAIEKAVRETVNVPRLFEAREQEPPPDALPDPLPDARSEQASQSEATGLHSAGAGVFATAEAPGSEAMLTRPILPGHVQTFRISVPQPFPGVQLRKSPNIDDKHDRFLQEIDMTGDWSMSKHREP
eukprot:Skav214705  [mRNA]  locus=scaffold331:155941:164173:- [translate_table: standard]